MDLKQNLIMTVIKIRRLRTVKERLNQDYNHLQREKGNIEFAAVDQSYLQQYRSDNEKLDVEQLLQEPHRPMAKFFLNQLLLMRLTILSLVKGAIFRQVC
ncbi:hypothetical protein EXT46_06890 [Pseudoalteromonas sp. CO325X]|uniref:hypothetical protein n=1 Tax=Pseudoalteromonas sp. CO325X TaxID=1777262 RepID=UPI001022E6BC|nr:hypothetical protein [Pseudoalteromonas sp. CO325X]RZF83168.1 hypothetical protein EXT46_06890 [Pseudoalteromonas sp. CO325X]